MTEALKLPYRERERYRAEGTEERPDGDYGRPEASLPDQDAGLEAPRR